MILFAIPKKSRINPTTHQLEYIVDESDYFDIPIVYPIDLSNPNDTNKIKEDNIQLISWNQAIYKTGLDDEIKITNIKELFYTILAVAQKDDVCINMNSQFVKLYNQDIFKTFSDFLEKNAPPQTSPEKHDVYTIIRTVYDYWPHPMIGNIANSPEIRPLTSKEQYEQNWNKFDKQYMSTTTKTKIQNLLDNPTESGLKPLKKSGRDQVKICKDWTEIVRAVIGEISSYISKILEKVYALELCKSDIFLEKQIKLLREIASHKKFYLIEEKKANLNLEELFKGKKDNVLLYLEYIYRYFKLEWDQIHDNDLRWYAFASFINSIYPITEENPPIIKISEEDTNKLDDNPLQKEAIKQIIKQSTTIPPNIRCAMAFNAIRRLERNRSNDFCNKSSIISIKKETEHFLGEQCQLVGAETRDYIPLIYLDKATRPDVKMYLYSWMRDEKDKTTITKRHFLMPLWAGPSGHASGLLEFYNTHFNEIRNPSIFIELASTLLPSIFAFWRLYYDKRLSGNHTLVESFEGLFYTIRGEENVISNTLSLNYFTTRFNLTNKAILDNDINTKPYVDANETLTHLMLSDGREISLNGIESSIGIMYRIYKKHYDPTITLPKNIDKLKKEIQKITDELVEKGYNVIEWSKDIVYTPRDEKNKYTSTSNMMQNLSLRSLRYNEDQDLFYGHEIIYSDDFQAPHPLQNIHSPSSEGQEQKRIAILHGLIDQSKNSFKFESNEKCHINPPQCLTDNGLQEFIGAMEFKNINFTTKFDETDTSFTFTADVDTSSDCWSCIKSTIPGLKSTENISCTVTDTEAQDSLLFHGEIRLDGQSITLRNASISLDKLVIESGLDSDWISCSIEASIKKNNQVSNDDTFKITIYHPLYSASINICGQYEDENKVVTIPKLVDLFGLDKIAPSSILPADENIFGTLGLQSLEINLERNAKAESETEAKSESDPFKITKLQFVISTEKKWSIFKNEKKEDLISLKPYFEIDIDSPFDDKKRNLFCSATGEWTLKGKNDDEDTKFYVTLTSYKTIYAGLAEGSTLHLDNVINLFAPEKKDLFPTDIKFTDLSLMADFDSSNYSLSIAAEDVYKFKAGNKEFSINGLSCSLDFWNGNFGELKLGGQFKLGPIDLNLYGTFSGNKAFSFTAEAFNDQEYCIGDFIHDVSTQLNCSEITPPDEIKEAYIRNFYVSYNSTGNEFVAKIDIEKVFEFKNYFSIDDLKFKISTTTSTQPKEQQPNELQSDEVKSNETTTFNFQICAYISICEKSLELGLDYDSNEKKSTFKGCVNELDITTEKLLELFGIDAKPFPKFIRDFKIEGIEATIVHQAENKDANQEEQNSFDLTLKTNAGTLIISVESGKETTWKIIYTTKDEHEKDLVNIDVLEIPVAGELVKKIDPTISNTTINNFKIEASNKSGVNLSLGCMAFGQEVNLEVPLSKPKADPQQEPKNFMLLKNENSPKFVFKGTAVWKKFDKPITILILTVPKIGIGIDNDGHIALLLDASLNVTPLTFSLHNAGAGLSLDSKEIVPYLSGFGVTFNNGVLSIGGSLSLQVDEQGNNEYSGTLLINFKEIGLTAMGSYSQGSMWAYLTLQAPIGGVPAFFIKGLAAGFGYNRRLTLPSIEEVNDYPLIKAAKDPSSITTDDLNEIIKQEKGQYFFAAGIKFTSFKIIDGFLLATVSFGNDCEVGLLGLAEITVPPNMNGKKCLAKAQLAIKSSIKPDDGIFSAEAQLTNESFILTKECKLTGGFAAYAWFGQNEHSGDFVVTLGGYHPSFVKPPHYPIVPRLGLNWQINKNISIIGEMYFALTPSILMAGGKLCATYEQDDLKAWFIAYADILMNWKPFKYDVSMGVTLGASYTVNLLFVKKTFSVELGADLHLWGPKLHGRIDVSWYIISFSIYFEESGNEQTETLNWDGFIDSFLTAPPNDVEKNIKANKYTIKDEDKDSRSDDILTISLEGVIEKINNTEIELDIVSPNLLVISAISKIPTEANARPVKDNPTVESTMRVIVEKINENITETVFDSDKETTDFEDIEQNLPAALWGEGSGNNLNEKDSVLKKICGKNLSIKDKSKLQKEDLFPQGERWILLSELYEDNKINIDDSFKFFKDKDIIPQYFENSIEELKNNENAEIEYSRNKAINDFLHGQGITISIKKFVDNADNLLSEEIVIIEE